MERMMIDMGTALICMTLATVQAAAEPNTSPTRNPQPCAQVAWDMALQVHSTSPCHFWRQSVLTAEAAQAEYLLPRNADDKPDVTFVRVKAYDGKHERFSISMMM
jgi:hypothetical protein